MKDTFQNKPILGTGIYTIPDMASILGIPYEKVLRWINTFWNDRFGSQYGYTYSWQVDLTKAVNFHTLIELYSFYQLSNAGVSTREILNAHEILSKQFNTPYPFAKKVVLEGINTDGKKIFFEQKDGSIYSVDVHKQFKIGFIKEFCKNLDFGTDSLAIRFWPIGKEKTIVCDPHYQFGQPVISGKNILAEVIAEMVAAGDSVKFIAKTYNINQRQVEDAIEYARKAA